MNNLETMKPKKLHYKTIPPTGLPLIIPKKWTGVEVKHNRQSLGWTQTKLAAEMGIRQQTLAAWESPTKKCNPLEEMQSARRLFFAPLAILLEKAARAGCAMSTDAFENYDEQREKAKQRECFKVIQQARLECDTESGEEFVDSCADFLIKNKFLTPAQIDALERIHSNYDCDDVSWQDIF